MASEKMSGGAMVGLAIILGIILLIFPLLVYWLAWAGIVILFLAGLFVWIAS